MAESENPGDGRNDEMNDFVIGEEEDKEEIMQTDLELMSREELMIYAKQKNIAVDESMSKDDIIGKIINIL